MKSRPVNTRRPSQQQSASFKVNHNEEIIAAVMRSSDLEHRKSYHRLQKTVRLLVLCIAFLLIVLMVIFYFLIFGISADALRLLVPSILANLITVLFIYIFTEVLLQSIVKYPIQKEELVQIERIIEEKIEEKLEPLTKEVAISWTKWTNIEMQLKKQDKEIACIKKMLEIGMVKLDEENVGLHKRVDALEDYLTLPHSA